MQSSNNNKRKASASIAMRVIGKRVEKQAEKLPAYTEVRRRELVRSLGLISSSNAPCSLKEHGGAGYFERKCNNLWVELSRAKAMLLSSSAEYEDELRVHKNSINALHQEVSALTKECNTLQSEFNKQAHDLSEANAMYKALCVAKLDMQRLHDRELSQAKKAADRIKVSRKKAQQRVLAVTALLENERNKVTTLRARTRLQTRMLLKIASQGTQTTGRPMIDSIGLIMPSLLRTIIAQATLGTLRSILLFENQRAIQGRDPMILTHLQSIIRPYEMSARWECQASYVQFIVDMPKDYYQRLRETPSSFNDRPAQPSQPDDVFNGYISYRGYNIDSKVLPLFNEYDIHPFVTMFVSTPMFRVFIKDDKTMVQELILSPQWGKIDSTTTSLRDMVASMKRTPLSFFRNFKLVDGDWVMMQSDFPIDDMCKCKEGSKCSCTVTQGPPGNRMGMLCALEFDQQSGKVMNEFCQVESDVKDALYCTKVVSETGWIVNDNNNWRIRDYFLSIADHTKNQVSLDETLFMTYVKTKLFGSECEPVGMLQQSEWCCIDKHACNVVGPPQHLRYWFDEIMDMSMEFNSDTYNRIAKLLSGSMKRIENHYSKYQAVLHENCKLQSMLRVVTELLKELSTKTTPIVNQIKNVMQCGTKVIVDFKIDGRRVSIKEKYDPKLPWTEALENTKLLHEYTNISSMANMTDKTKTVVKLSPGVTHDPRSRTSDMYAPFEDVHSETIQRTEDIERIERNHSTSSGWAVSMETDSGHGRMTLISPPGESSSSTSYPIQSGGGGGPNPTDLLNHDGVRPAENVRMSPPPPRARRSSIFEMLRQSGHAVLGEVHPLTRQNAVDTDDVSTDGVSSSDDDTRVQSPNGSQARTNAMVSISRGNTAQVEQMSRDLMRAIEDNAYDDSPASRTPLTRSITRGRTLARRSNRYGPLASGSSSDESASSIITPPDNIVPRHTLYDYSDDMIALRATNDPNENVPIRERIHHLRLWFVEETIGRDLDEARNIGLRYSRILRDLTAMQHTPNVSDVSDESSTDNDSDSDYMESKEEEEEMRETKEDIPDDSLEDTEMDDDLPVDDESNYVFQRMEDGSLPSAQPDLVPPPGV